MTFVLLGKGQVLECNNPRLPYIPIRPGVVPEGSIWGGSPMAVPWVVSGNETCGSNIVYDLLDGCGWVHGVIRGPVDHRPSIPI